MTATPARAALLAAVAGRVPAGAGHCVRVAVDGVDGAGKTTFADELAGVLRSAGREVVRASADDFLAPRAVRHARGRESADGFWLDSYDYPALRASLLDPLGPGGSGRFRTGVYDLRSEAPAERPWQQAPPGAVLVLDGLFLHRDALAGCWELSVWLDVPFEVSVGRMAVRDGSHPGPGHPSLARYVGGQRLYFAACRPWERAGVVVDNADLGRPLLLRG